MVVDDSAVMRKLISEILERDKQIQVVGTAMDGVFALGKIPKLKPDVITLDLEMPRMDGLTALPRIVREYKIPVLLVSSLTRKGASLTFKALEMGAVDFVAKTQDSMSVDSGGLSGELIQKVKWVSKIKVGKVQPAAVLLPPQKEKTPVVFSPTESPIVAIGVSTGGPKALSEILPQLPSNFPAGLVIVQHMPEKFTKMLADRLNQMCRIKVKEAEDGDMILPGRALLAPGNLHMKIQKLPQAAPVVVLSRDEQGKGHRPSVDVLFKSAAEELGSEAIGLIMTGMGDDGVEGIGAMKKVGAYTLAQDENTSVIYGMPRVAAQKGFIKKVLPLHEIIPHLVARVGDITPKVTEAAGIFKDPE